MGFKSGERDAKRDIKYSYCLDHPERYLRIRCGHSSPVIMILVIMKLCRGQNVTISSSGAAEDTPCRGDDARQLHRGVVVLPCLKLRPEVVWHRILMFWKFPLGILAADGVKRKVVVARSTIHGLHLLGHLGVWCETPVPSIEDLIANLSIASGRIRGMPGILQNDFWHRTAMAGSDVVQSVRPIFDDFFQHLWPYIGNNTANVVFQIVKRLWLIRIDQ
ncbi:hypothetical protein TNCV_5065341 [Trichonephila clavipes]|nr:hypothetical protein TNCV_5065341 [Trichonephila clavipes]